MAALSEADLFAIWTEIMSAWSARREALGAFTKAELRAAVDAADAWVDANGGSYNTALPQPFRGEATAAQKAELLVFVTRHRWEVE